MTRLQQVRSAVKFTRPIHRIFTRNCNHDASKKKTKLKQQRLHANHEVVNFIQENYDNTGVLSDIKESMMHSMLTNPPQIVGFQLAEIKRRVVMFKSFHFSGTDSVLISLNIPSCLKINNSNFKKILKILQIHNLPVEKLLYLHPYIGAYDHRQVERNLQLLSSQFEKNSELIFQNLILDCPMLLSYPLNMASLKLLKETTFGLSKESTVIKNIKLAMETPAVSNQDIDTFSLDGNTNKQYLFITAKDFLSNYNAGIERIYIKCPQFFVTPKETLEACVTNLSSEPFFCNAEDIEKLLNSYPDVFIRFNDKEVLEQAAFIANIAVTKTRPYKLLTEYPELFHNPAKFFCRVQLLEKYGFQYPDIGRLLSQKGGTNCFIECADFTDHSIERMLEFYMDGKDITPIQIVVSAPISLSQKSTNIVKARLSFLRHKKQVKILARGKKKKQHQITLQSIVRMKLNDFIENICSATMEDYEIYCKKMKIKNYKAAYQNAEL